MASKINFSNITTLLFDIDNTLLLFDEKEFIPNYSRLIYKYFQREFPNLEIFTQIFLLSTHKMLVKDPKRITNLEKFTLDFSNRMGGNLTSQEIKNRFFRFYKEDFQILSEIITPHPLAKDILELAAPYFKLVAATNPIFPAIANEIRLGWAKINSNQINWFEVTSADDYTFSKPQIEYYEELLRRINESAENCLMIGNDPINDLVAGKLGIKTFIIQDGRNKYNKVIKTDLDAKAPKFKADYSGTLDEFYAELKSFIKKKENNLKYE
ncbi:HAD family hydrolase [Candidatus Hodarchaeum mangrovi]